MISSQIIPIPTNANHSQRTLISRHSFCSFDRYTELEEKHGKLARLVDVSLKTSDYVTVEVQVEGQTGSSSLKRINLKWTTIDLRKFIAKEYGIEAGQKFRLFFDSHVIPNGAELMSFPKRTMLNYRVEDGDTIIVVMDFRYTEGRGPMFPTNSK